MENVVVGLECLRSVELVVSSLGKDSRPVSTTTTMDVGVAVVTDPSFLLFFCSLFFVVVIHVLFVGSIFFNLEFL